MLQITHWRLFLFQASRNHSNPLRLCCVHLVCTSVLRSYLNHLGELRQWKDPQIWKQHTLPTSLTSRHHSLYFLGCCCCSWTRIVHQFVRCFLFEHLGPRFSSNHGNMRALARQTRKTQLDHVERHRTCDLRIGWINIRNVLVDD